MPAGGGARSGAIIRVGREVLAAMIRRNDRTWPVDMLLYLMQHDAHHRGQIFMLAKSLGHEFRGEDVTRVWGWRAI